MAIGPSSFNAQTENKKERKKQIDYAHVIISYIRHDFEVDVAILLRGHVGSS